MKKNFATALGIFVLLAGTTAGFSCHATNIEKGWAPDGDAAALTVPAPPKESSWSIGPSTGYWNTNQPSASLAGSYDCTTGCVEPHNQEFEAGLQVTYHF